MKLSIITVNLNNCDGLQKTIDSVICQTFRDFEWIVIDGGSTDGSRELIEQYSERFAYWVSEPDKGIYYAMNKGIRVAKGEYLQFLNSGDWLHDNNVLKDVFSTKHFAGIVYCDYEFYVKDELFSTETLPSNLQFSYLVNHWLGHSASFIKRELLAKTPYDENYHIASDWKFFIQQALSGQTFQHLARIVSCQDDTGISVTHQTEVLEERNDIISSIVPLCIQNDINIINSLTSDQNMIEIKKYKDEYWLYRKMMHLSLIIVRFFDHSKRC